MRRQDFHYQLPSELIAQHPLPQRSASRLLCLNGETGGVTDRQFRELPSLLKPGDLLVFNDTRVIPARLFGRKDSGGAVELLVERILDDKHALVLARASKPLRHGMHIRVADAADVTVLDHAGEFIQVEFTDAVLPGFLHQHGHVPLPPYVQHADSAEDRERYQTVYAKVPGAVAAPTAGLHFDEEILKELDHLGVAHTYVTLHVGAGTFQPVREDDILEHRMHSEQVFVSKKVCDAVADTQRRGGRVVAVGTTAVRSLETAAADDGSLQPFSGETTLFIYPGYRFRVVDVMLTNFHLPESTLLMLVAAFAGRENILAAYLHAVEQRYRFFSYGDAMFITVSPDARMRA
ncbi:MAG TPA: tRNA preQ1(34) S-adenosylmethionine ribosyltransferase-isomerase QueA [Gammaproteobacteria bacterium]|nr:tRNA preQ1(34) S-adenosylmethionine ribosyltransferase-isomerase QueA [Gammaproteobacteria bacterium]